ncbi:ribosome biogenesis factor YjgA, partial [Desulfovibrio porci]|uniref:ribosome biogenesis factor YjgA n=1 Tax=Desulfovibrio porci TaxID=2605782 RepID=UPI002A80DE9E
MPRKKTYQWQADGEAEHEAAPSRSAKKRQSLALQNLGEELTRLAPAELRDFDLPPDLLEALALYARIRDHEGRRRQMQYIGRLMRETDAERLRAALAARREAGSADTPRFQLVEQRRERQLAAP